MKRIYLLVLLFVAFGFNAMAQPDIVLSKTISDTIKFNDPVLTYYIIQYKFTNKGTSLAATDKLVLDAFSSTTNRNLSLPAASSNPPWPGGLPKDSSVYLNDTFGFKSAPNPNPANLCDTVWSVNSGGTLIADAQPNDNKDCDMVRFIPDPKATVSVVSEDNKLEVYPNPANNTINISYNFRKTDNAVLVITDMLGTVVKKADLGNNFGRTVIPVDISSLSNGLYMAQLSIGEDKVVNKFSVQK